ncbi:MAG TPA: efflux RND transporter permease subunit [Burkholderiaceae bacterium]|nr:efflux RND transporter permease subunit [Burkholderiaceae bacterium]
MLVDIVRVALKRPYTFVVMALLLLLIGPLAALRTPTDIFPEIRIPVIAVAWQYTGLQPDEMAGRISTLFQRALTTTVNDVEHIEATTYTGISVVKVFFQPTVDIAIANAQVAAISQTVVKQMPPGATPPLILNFNAATVPILQLALSGKGMSEQQLFDVGVNTVRPPLVTVAGAAVPYPYGGKQRQVQIDLDSAALRAHGLSAQDVANALAAQNLIVPIGTEKIGGYEYALLLNDAPSAIADLGNMPIKVGADGGTVYIRDVAQVHDGNSPQTNIVHVDGGRSVLMSVLKNGSASTLAIVAGIRDKLAQGKSQWPDTLSVLPINDQSIFVRAAITGVALEGAIAAALTSLMILVFLGSWRSTVIIAVSIPLSILGSIIALSAVGQTLNIMTLGGLALAVGILVDDATVTIENINWHLEQGKDVETSIMDGARQIVTPAFVSLLCICIVFVPMFFLEGVARFLFVPMAEAVMFAMACSFILSRTLVPTMANYLLHRHDVHGEVQPTSNPLVKFQRAFEARFERLRAGYRRVLELAMTRRGVFVTGFMAFVLVSFALVPFIGSNFFPSVDSGQILMHARVPVGTRVEETARRFAQIEDAIARVVPPEETATIVDNVGLPISSINLTYNNTGVIGSQDGDVQIALREGHHPSADYVRRLRETLPREFPDTVFSFPPADIVSQILNFGAPAPIDLQVRGNDLDANFAYANSLLKRLRAIPGVADARIQQSDRAQVFDVDVDRTRAQTVGLTERDVTNSLVVNLAGSSQVAPTYWLNPVNGVSYSIVMQTPQYKLDTLTALANLPISGAGNATAGANGAPQVLGGLARFHRHTGNAVVSQYDLQRLVQINATTQDRDLAAVAGDIQRVIDETKAQVPHGSQVVMLGQVRTMNVAFSGLLFGLIGAIGLIYLLIVVNFQSWSDPFVIVCALPAALAGIVWMLFATHTTFSVPALTGAIMCMGVATANSVLVISFAREKLVELGDPVAAALEAGFVRFRPVLMTALAMVIGMLPMSLGLGEGGEQNAPLGRAVIGGLLLATLTTLFFVPVMYSVLRRKPPTTDPLLEEL